MNTEVWLCILRLGLNVRNTSAGEPRRKLLHNNDLGLSPPNTMDSSFSRVTL
jgi:hypothetical protein